MELTITERQLRALKVLANHGTPDMKVPIGKDDFVHGEELRDLQYRLELAINPPVKRAVKVKVTE